MLIRPPKISHETDSFNTISVSGWFFFTLLNAFYGGKLLIKEVMFFISDFICPIGALTMFFVTLPTLPFEDVHGALREYPDWMMMFLNVNSYFYY